IVLMRSRIRIDSADIGPYRLQSLFNILIPPFDLFDVVNDRFPLRRKRRNKERYSSPDIRRSHLDATQLKSLVKSNYRSPVGVTENNLCAHINQFIHKKQPAFKHFLMDQHVTLGLCGNYEYDAQ